MQVFSVQMKLLAGTIYLDRGELEILLKAKTSMLDRIFGK
jgi:hypothetical protein